MNTFFYELNEQTHVGFCGQFGKIINDSKAKHTLLLLLCIFYKPGKKLREKSTSIHTAVFVAVVVVMFRSNTTIFFKELSRLFVPIHQLRK